MNRVVVVSNRVPAAPRGSQQAGGLAVALDAMMGRRGGLWFGWSGEVTSAGRNAPVIKRDGAVEYATIDLTEVEHRGYYAGYSNDVLWPMLHNLPQLMHFRRSDYDCYMRVNRRFADHLVPMLRPDDAIWVHDYQLMALPGALRARGVTNNAGFFLHVPFPAPEAVAAAPGIKRVLRELMGSDLLGFQTRTDRDNFAATAALLLRAERFDAEHISLDGHAVQLGVFPVEIAAEEFAQTAAAQVQLPPSRRLATSLGGRALLLGIDRMDPTKGLPERLDAYGRLLARRPPRSTTMLNIAAPSREDVPAYRTLRHDLETAAGAINSAFGEPDWTPLRLIAKAQGRDTLAGFMRLARVGVVTPIRDGMNLVAKEFIAAQDPADPGVLILSLFAGAAAQLGSALLVNPHDVESMADAMQQALDMPPGERRERWKLAWNAIRGATPEEWGESFMHVLTDNRLAAMPVVGRA
ncbi:alpha,alpha-trehalose-phosphate synthase (UDP-forming) [Plastoroseomonas arctica]|uniref:Trehalose-6-phosphate synthase n=1 Tax=Plastoroseomonas arctica TaxID=1509237 RepID=A0AAF1KLD6_9PROT|nr:trehalose-6-phosphate synthase [Plastoroseomonas arctica]MBR0654626.1 trehalose-6-phosphate synthase [Plastoroseomonas arctica]